MLLDAQTRDQDRRDGVATHSPDYRRVAEALAYVVARFEDQPSLEEIAAHIGLSPFHFQRLFTQWVGVSPKKFLQALSLEQAKQRLDAHASVMEAAFDAGLSGPGRLHDLFVAHEAMTPGEYKTLGADLLIRHGVHDGPFGETILLTTERGLCGLAFVDQRGRAACLDDMTRRFALATHVEDKAATAPLMDRIFADPAGAAPSGEPLKLLLKGTEFQIKVWRALMAIPPGALTSYGAVAGALGMQGAASRAVGTAVAANPISWLIPCHRVIRNSGLLGGYRWGLPRKLAMMGWERAGLPAPQGGAPSCAA
ncbi:MAG: bifunctional helix-turn-helix domain-containing protein/methylated-DNA--[protein]-cysteine S-methyltransferase [Alphaproteobacteria bacterium]|nr:bifunctional helix-turn-helix domain-containing protein/methylated-DNA--[protein]-cysteine S-methyltransferase [Alphaproteobacteria bacterium]